MEKTARVVLLCLMTIAQVGMFAFAWRAFQQTSDILWATRMDYKALVLEAKGIIIDFGIDPPFLAPVFPMFGVCLLLTVALLVDEIRKGKDKPLSSLQR